MGLTTENVDFKKNLKFFWSIARHYKKYLFLASISILIVAITEVLETYLFKEIVDNGTMFSSGVITQIVFTNFLIIILIIFIIIAIINTISNWARFHYINVLDTKLTIDLKNIFFHHILNLSHNFHSSHRTGSLIARFTRGGKSIEAITDFFVFEVIPFLFRFLAAVVSVFLLDNFSALILMLMVLFFMTFSWIILKKQLKASVAFNTNEDIEKAHISDSFTNIETVKYFGKENLINKQFNLLNKKTQEAQLKEWDFARTLVAGHQIILYVTLIILLVLPIIQFINGEITIGTLVFIYTIYSFIARPLEKFAWSLRRFYTEMANFKSLIDYKDINNEIKDFMDARNIKVKNGEIEFNKVSFKYKKKKVIDKVSFKINKNEKVALVGHSGSGKTTLIKLLYRLYDVNEGEIKIDNKNINTLKQISLRNELSIVPQEGILFNDTIYNNVLFSNPTATKKDVIRALKAANFYKFVQSLPEKENTYVGERGIKLSGGEKQRLSIARAILANKKILVLDEATSALDSKTENQIQKALWKLIKGRTTIIIAHRLSTIMHVDRIIVMDKGCVVQEGKHSELIKKRGIYKELWALQKGGYLQD